MSAGALQNPYVCGVGKGSGLHLLAGRGHGLGPACREFVSGGGAIIPDTVGVDHAPGNGPEGGNVEGNSDLVEAGPKSFGRGHQAKVSGRDDVQFVHGSGEGFQRAIWQGAAGADGVGSALGSKEGEKPFLSSGGEAEDFVQKKQGVGSASGGAEGLG